MQVPEKASLYYDNYLVAILDNKSYAEFNFVFSKGTTSQQKSSCQLTESRIEPADAQIKRIVTWYDTNAIFWGIQFFDKNNNKLLQSKANVFLIKSYCKETILDDDERIIGVKFT